MLNYNGAVLMKRENSTLVYLGAASERSKDKLTYETEYSKSDEMDMKCSGPIDIKMPGLNDINTIPSETHFKSSMSIHSLVCVIRD
jgi:hypothetical protein